MCEPVSMAVGGLSAFANIQGQKTQAKMQKMQQEAASKAERGRAAAQYSSMRAQEAAENRAAAVELQQAQVKQYEAMGSAAALDKGFGGANYRAIQGSYMQALASERNSVFKQLAENSIQRDFGFASAQAQEVSNLVGINKPIAPVDYLGAIAGGASTALGTMGALNDAGVVTPKGGGAKGFNYNLPFTK